MLLVDWTLANFLMAAMTISLFGIAVIMLYVAFTRKEGAADSKEKYMNDKPNSDAP